MLKLKKQYQFVDPRDLVRSEAHQLGMPQIGNPQNMGLTESYTNYSRVNPVVYYEDVQDGKVVFRLVDGWKAVQHALDNGSESIYACKLTFDSPSDIPLIVAQLQMSTHQDCSSTYHLINLVWDHCLVGKGRRTDLLRDEVQDSVNNTDLSEDDLDQAYSSENENIRGDKPLNIYQRVGLKLGIKPTRVQYIKKVGDVNPSYFEMIDSGRMPLYKAYSDCKKAESNFMPPPPSIKPITYHVTHTQIPSFGDSTTTHTSHPYANAGVDVAEDKQQSSRGDFNSAARDMVDEWLSEALGVQKQSLDSSAMVSEAVSQADETSDTFFVSGICQNCRCQTQIKVKKSNLNK